MVYRLLYEQVKKRSKRLKRSIEVAENKNRNYRRKIAELRRSLSKERREKASLEDGFVVEWCIYCSRQITMLWSVKEDGLIAFCPHCGKKMMLCEQCQGDCDYDYGIEVCKEM